MAKKSSVSKVSNGGRQKNNVAKEAARQARFARRTENGKKYSYKKNPYKKGTVEYTTEAKDREEKNISSRLPYTRLTSLFAKLENEVKRDREKAKAKKELGNKKAS